MRYRFEVPGVPTPKARARVTSRGTFTPDSTRKYESKVRLCAYTAGVKKIAGPVVLSLVLYMPDRRRRDGENIQKAIQDALNGLAYDDDSQVTEWHGRMEVDKANPRAVVTLEPVQEMRQGNMRQLGLSAAVVSPPKRGAHAPDPKAAPDGHLREG